MNEIVSAEKNYLLDVNEEDYVNYLVTKYQIESLVLHPDKKTVSDKEQMIQSNKFPSGYYDDLRIGYSYIKQVITYHIPYSGNKDLFKYQPSSGYYTYDENLDLKQDCICFEIINFRNNSEEINRKANGIIGNIASLVNNIVGEVEKFNQCLKQFSLDQLKSRKETLLKQFNFLDSLEVPIKKSENVPSTFAVPVVKKKVVPSASTTTYKPEPTLDNSIYQAILKIIQHTGIEMERLPDIYQGKGEETLRNHFIMVLSPHYDSATGETFNRSGKTDILIKHEQTNIFVAECKFWTGIKGFFDTIDQLLHYLTWRDSKAAIICFVKNNELNPVLQQIEEQTKNHPCFVKYLGKQDDAWFDFDFHLKDDPSRNIKLAVLCFHFPPS